MKRANPLRRPVLYPNRYAWYVFVCALDIICTRIVLYFGGYEVNQLAQRAIGLAGVWGLVLLKFISVVVVVVICETVGNANFRKGRALAGFAIGLSAMPVVIGLAQLGALTVSGRLTPAEVESGTPLDRSEPRTYAPLRPR